MPATKVATCCYCGTKAALVLNGSSQHELACSSCGAPLHDMKMLRADHVTGGYKSGKKPGKKSKHAMADRLHWERELPERKKKKKKVKKRKGFGARLFDEAFDVLDDIFD